MGLEDVGYHVLGPIARGGMAEVVLAERIGPGGVRKRLAIKRLLPDVASDPELVSLLENEARIAVELDHPNVVSVFELGEADGELFIAMEFVRGWDLATIIDACAKRGADIPLPIALFVAREICRALEYAHEKTDDHGSRLGIVHRDVTPSNVLVSVDGLVKLADFGIARAAALARTTSSGSRRGKVPYLSPEQIAGDPVDARSDLYCLGIVLFGLLSGRPLFADDIATAARDRQKPLARLAKLRETTGALQPLLDRMLAAAPSARHASAHALGVALDAAIDAHPPAASAPALKAFVESLRLPPPVGPANVGDGERTVRIALGANGRAGAAEVTTEPLPPPSPPPAAPRTRPLAIAAALGGVFAMSALVARSVGTREGTIEVRTTPPGATVWVEGAARGTTPTTIRSLPRKVVVLKIGLDESRAEEHTFDLASTPDQALDIDVR